MTGTGECASQPGHAVLVLVLNSGSSSVKFALVDPGNGQRVTDGLAERVGTPEAVLRTRRARDDVVTERLADGSYRAVIARILGDLPRAGLAGVGHRVVHGGERFTRSVLVSHPGATVALVVPTDEELLIARDTARIVAPVAAGRARS